MGADTPEDNDDSNAAGPANGPKHCKKVDCMKDFLSVFQSLDIDTKATTTVYEMRYGEDSNLVLVWQILGDGRWGTYSKP
jgi:hypothetical protein